MTPSEEDDMRANLDQRDMSSTSLEGMERPVRSFKSFIQAAPPNPSETDKALPPTPISWIRPSSAEEETSTPTTANRSPEPQENDPSATPWKAPAEWYDDDASGKSVHNSPSPPLLAPTSAPRTFSPLLPEPSPSLIGTTEPRAWLAPGPPPASRLLPIYERTNGSSDLGPPGSPPRSPLPSPPPLKNESSDSIVHSEHRRTRSSPSREAVTNFRVRQLSHHGFGNEKAYASLGLDSPHSTSSYDSEFSHQGESRADRQYLRDKKLRALNKGSPLDDDSWEDEDMDDKTRQLSFSQDYHDLLANQYQQMNVRVQEVLSSGGVQHVQDAQFAESRRTSDPATSPNRSTERGAERSANAGKKIRHKRLSSLIPHRAGGSEANNVEMSGSKRTPDPNTGKIHIEDHQTSRLISSFGSIKFSMKQRKNDAAQTSAVPATPSRPYALKRLPEGLALLRTHLTSPVPKLDVARDDSPTSTHTRGSSQCGSDYSATAPDSRFSYNSSHSPSKPNIPIVQNSAFGTMKGSHSQRLGASHSRVQEAPMSPATPTLSLSPAISQLLRDQSNGTQNRYMPEFIDKAKQARRRRLTEARQDRLKRSIKVLGPTDPCIAQAGYVKPEERFERSERELNSRLPGYMIRGPV